MYIAIFPVIIILVYNINTSIVYSHCSYITTHDSVSCSPGSQHATLWVYWQEEQCNFHVYIASCCFYETWEVFTSFHHTGSLAIPCCWNTVQHFRHDGMQACIDLAILDRNYNTHVNKQLPNQVFQNLLKCHCK